jgi:iron complex outermembrane recepter protein
MTSNPRLARAIRIALITSAASASVGLSTGVSAQDQDQEQAGEMTGTMTVTGSRIARQDFEAASPVVTVSADTFDLSGEVQVETVLNSLPQLVPSITTTSNNPSNGGQANVDLRGLGTQRTLVLMDGSRLPGSNVSGVVDLNTIPSALIESVEILTGGASSTYGSDAIAGVINVRMKRNFQGAQFSVQNNVTAESDGRTFLAEGVFGANFADDRGNAVLSLTYDKRDELFAGARDFGVVSLGPAVVMGVPQLVPLGSPTVPDGAVAWGTNLPDQNVVNTVFGRYGAAAGSVLNSNVIGFNNNETIFSFGGGSEANPVVNYLGNTADPGFNPLSYSYNFGPVNYLQLPLERRQIAAFTHFDLMPDGGAELYSRMMFTTYNSDQQLASTPVTCAGTALGCSIPLLVPNPAGPAGSMMTNPTIPADLLEIANSRPTPGAPLSFTKRITEVGFRSQENGYDVLQGLLGFRGDFQLGDQQWHWDVFGAYGRSEGVSLQGGNVSRARLQAGLNNPAVYAAQGCPEFNVFGSTGLQPACANAIVIQATNILEFEQTNYIASLAGGIFNLPAGAVDMVVGAEYREDVANFRPDSFLSSGDVVGFNASQPVGGRITVLEPFAELAVPVVADMPGASYLGLEFGYRNSNYNIASSYDTYKAALLWNPIESLKLRGSFNRAIRAPNIVELFLPRQENFPQAADPCSVNSPFRLGSDGLPGGTGGAADSPNVAQVESLCLQQGFTAATLANFRQPSPQIRSIVGGNLGLSPEEADTYTLGLAWQSDMTSEWAADLSVSLDFFNYEIKNVIASLTTSSVLGRCFNQLGTNPGYTNDDVACQLFSRNVTGNLGVDAVVTTQLNLSAREVAGYDLNLDWGLPLSAFGAGDDAGKLDFRLLMTVFDKWEQQETAADDFLDRAGTISQTVASAFPEYKAVLSTTYTIGDFSFRYNARYTKGMEVINNDALLTPSTSAVTTVDNFLYHDIVGKWTMNDMLAFTLGVTNIGDKDPPIYATNTQAGIQSNTDPSTYDVLGRRYFANITATF